MTYYGYVAARRSDGYREDARSDSSAQYLALTVPLSSTLSLRGQVGRSTYRYRIPGPLTDSMFRADPRMSTRSRNYFSPDIIVPGVRLEWRPREGTRATAQVSSVVGDRNSVQFAGFATTPDVPNQTTGEFAPRQVDIDNFQSYTGELRLTHEYELSWLNGLLATGLAFGNNDLRRRQQGRGTTGSDYDLTITPAGFGRDIHYRSKSIAGYVENMMRLTPQSFYNARYRDGIIAVDGRNTSIKGKRVEIVPRWISRTGLTTVMPRVTSSLTLSYTSESFADPLNTEAASANGARGLVPSYTLVDWSGSIEIARWLRVRGGVSNLFDKAYFTKRPQFYPGPGVWPSDGRSVQLSMSIAP